jgi:hypothetical protein
MTRSDLRCVPELVQAVAAASQLAVVVAHEKARVGDHQLGPVGGLRHR